MGECAEDGSLLMVLWEIVTLVRLNSFLIVQNMCTVVVVRVETKKKLI